MAVVTTPPIVDSGVQLTDGSCLNIKPANLQFDTDFPSVAPVIAPVAAMTSLATAQDIANVVDDEIYINHIRLAASFVNSGAAFASKGKNKDAMEMFKKALSIRQENLGDQHLDTAAVHNNLGFVYQVPHRFQMFFSHFQGISPISISGKGCLRKRSSATTAPWRSVQPC